MLLLLFLYCQHSYILLVMHVCNYATVPQIVYDSDVKVKPKIVITFNNFKTY